MTIFPTGLTYSRNTKDPMEGDNLYDTLTEAQLYVNNVDRNAYVGQVISVTNDGVNTGAYMVKQIAGQVIGTDTDGKDIIATVGILEKLQGSSSVDTIWGDELPE